MASGMEQFPILSGPPVSVADADPRIMTVELTWGPGTDLDLAVMFRLTDGSDGTLQSLAKLYGSTDEPPFMRLDGDKRDGGLERLEVNLELLPSIIDRAVVFCYCHDDTGNFLGDARDPWVRVTHPRDGEINMDLSGCGRVNSCALLLLERGHDSEITYAVEEAYFEGFHPVIDAAYELGIEWVDGTKE